MTRRRDEARSELAVALGGRIRELRVEQGWSLLELSSRAGIARQTLNLFELGRMEPRIGTLAEIATALRVSVRDLMPAPEPDRARLRDLLDGLPDDALPDAIAALELVRRAWGGRAVPVRVAAETPRSPRRRTTRTAAVRRS